MSIIIHLIAGLIPLRHTYSLAQVFLFHSIGYTKFSETEYLNSYFFMSVDSVAQRWTVTG